MKNYQRRKVFIKNDEVKEFKSYTKDGFYYKSTKVNKKGYFYKFDKIFNL